jgi:hypothetical protein
MAQFRLPVIIFTIALAFIIPMIISRRTQVIGNQFFQATIQSHHSADCAGQINES